MNALRFAAKVKSEGDTDELYLTDIYKAVAKQTKCKYFVRVNLTAGVVQTGFGEKKSVKPAAKTSVYIYNKKAELKKEIHAIASVSAVLSSSLEDKSEITNQFPELVERSIQLAAENLNKKGQAV